MKKRLFIILTLLAFASSSSGSNGVTQCDENITPHNRNKRIWITNLTGIGLITTWGIMNWDYFSTSPHSKSEGWFSKNTKEGGSDKLGHFFTNYVAAHGLSYLYESWCFSKNDAALYGALSSFAMMGYMELGDSFSSYGFSHEDFLVNMAGSVFGYITYKNPDLRNKIDFRWEYGFHPNDDDFITDYENSKHLIAIKFNGFDSTSQGLLKHLELHLGYYTRGFSETCDEKKRNLYVGLGLNLTDFFRRRGCHKTAKLLNYIQIPGTYVTFKQDLND